MIIIMFPVDSAVSMAEANIDSEKIKLKENAEYKYISAFPTVEGGEYMVYCSKDALCWEVCVGAKIKDEPVDFQEIIQFIKDHQKECEA